MKKCKIDEYKFGVIFVDLKRPFETIDRNRVISKLHQCGIKETVLDWFRSYLSSYLNRRQQVKLNNCKSLYMKTKYVVPQGSVLVPLLFLLYINDIVQINTKNCKIYLFADDTIAYVKGSYCVEIERKLPGL